MSQSENGNGNGNGRVTFQEVRRMARWLDTFTPQDLADALRVPVELADDFVTALLFHDLCADSDEVADGPEGLESVYEMHPIPPGPNEHPHSVPPEIMAVIQMGGVLLYDHRGLPVRIRTERQLRRSLSTPGARQVHKNRERAYRRAEQAKLERQRIEKKKARAAAEHKHISEFD